MCGSPQDSRIERRDAEPQELARILRAVLGLSPDDPAHGELAASLGRPLPQLIRRINAGAWIAWCIAGLRLFEDPGADPRCFRFEADRLVVVLAMSRSGGNISVAAHGMGISRATLRNRLRQFDLYPWPISRR